MNDNSFYSIDRLVEFGMGVAMAQQMVRMMNQTMQSIYVPGSVNTIPAPQPLAIYAGIDGHPVGPLSESEFAAMTDKKQITPSTLVWIPGMIGWKPVCEVPVVLQIVATTPPPLPKE